MELVGILLIIVGVYIGWNIGANDAANCLGTAVGSGVIGYKKAALAVAALAFAGAALQGGRTISTIGTGIFNPNDISSLVILISLLVAGIVVTVATLEGLPVSITQAVIGAVAGAGLVIKTELHWGMIAKIFVFGFITPVIAALFSYLVYKIFRALTSNFATLFFERYTKWIVVLTGLFLAYGLGANNVGNAMGLVVGKELLIPFTAGIVGGIAISIGAMTFGRRVMMTVGQRITKMDSTMALAAQAGAGIAVYLLTMIGIPTSTTFGIVGGVFGVGFVKGVSAIETNTLKSITIGWILTPILSAVLTIILVKVFI